VRVSNKFQVAISGRNLQVVRSSLKRAGETTNFVVEVWLSARQLQWLLASTFPFHKHASSHFGIY